MPFDKSLAFGEASGQLNILSSGAIEDLNINFYHAGDGIHVDFMANPHLYSEQENSRHHARFLELFATFSAAPRDSLVEHLAIIGQSEQAACIDAPNRTAHEVSDATLTDMLAAAFQAAPGQTALHFEGAELSYAELDARVNQLARQLISDGVGPESLVAVGIRRSLELVVAINAILRAGGAYVPIDPDHPAERTAYILESAAPVCIMTTAADDLDLPADIPTILVDVDEPSDFSAEPITDADHRGLLRPGNTAYVIFTSGSTGRPRESPSPTTPSPTSWRSCSLSTRSPAMTSTYRRPRRRSTCRCGASSFPFSSARSLSSPRPMGTATGLRRECHRPARRDDHRLRSVDADGVHRSGEWRGRMLNAAPCVRHW